MPVKDYITPNGCLVLHLKADRKVIDSTIVNYSSTLGLDRVVRDLENERIGVDDIRPGEYYVVLQPVKLLKVYKKPETKAEHVFHGKVYVDLD